MKSLGNICFALSAAAAFAAGTFWVISTRVEVKHSGEGGIGPGWDGYMVVLNADGSPIELIGSYRKQAIWNRRAAWAAAVAALFQAIGTAIQSVS